MRLHALLNWWDEPPGDLAAVIIGARKAGIDHFTAFDGAYALFEGATAASGPDQANTIRQVTAELGMGCTIHTPQHVWLDNEVEKRTAMFRTAWAVSDPGDWWIILDADTVITQTPHDLKQRLADTDLEVATVTVEQPRNLDTSLPQARKFNYPRAGRHPQRLMYKAQPLRCQNNHYTYVTADDRVLWASDSGTQEPCIDISDLVVQHRDGQRALDRHQAKHAYYKRRDQLGVERSICTWKNCDDQATQTVAINFRISDTGKGAVADLAEACPKHAKRIDYENRWWLKQHGVDPDACRSELRDGAAA